MRQARHKFQISFAMLLLLFLSVFASLPKPARAESVIEKFPTTTSVVVAGWNNPTYVYVSGDGNWADSTTNNAQQEYGDFGFNFNATDTIEKVYVRIKSEAGVAVAAPSWGSEFQGLIRVYDAGTWRIYTVVDLIASTISGLDDAWVFEYLLLRVQAFDITDYINTPSDLNNLKLRIRSYLIGDAFYWWVEALSVEVSYTTTESEENTAKWLLIGSIFSAPIMLALALHQRKHRKP